MKRSLFVGILASLPAAAIAQLVPPTMQSDTHVQTVIFQPDQVVRLQAVVGYALMVALAPDEQVQTVAVGDAANWQVTANHAGNLLFLKAQQSGATTNMTVVTSARIYHFLLSANGGGEPEAYTVRFTFPPATLPLTLPTGAMMGRYRLSGSPALRPDAISDDGRKTYIQWPVNGSLPATYVVDASGREALANGSMRDGFYVIDGIEARFVFRLDREVARADRLKQARADR